MGNDYEKETKEIIHKINEILETEFGDQDSTLQKMNEEFIRNNDQSQNRGKNHSQHLLIKIEDKVISEKYKSYIDYIRNVWVPRYKKGILAYASFNKENGRVMQLKVITKDFKTN